MNVMVESDNNIESEIGKVIPNYSENFFFLSFILPCFIQSISDSIHKLNHLAQMLDVAGKLFYEVALARVNDVKNLQDVF